MAYSCTSCSEPGGDGTDSPILHYGPDRYHYDCLPEHVRADVLGDQSTARQRALSEVIARATDDSKNHLHGEALRKHITKAFAKVDEQEAKERQDG